MALDGRALADPLAGPVRNELQARLLVPAATEAGYDLTMDPPVYRERPATARRVEPGTQLPWGHLQLQAAPRAPTLPRTSSTSAPP